ncbi:MAG: hypothetical protein JWP27_2913 [Flaviaesturariibacter sp.]|nr:hypothetical protein [Flaviaesturariibacter sp.]
MSITRASKDLYQPLSPAHRQRLADMVAKLRPLPGTEASLSATEICFYELLQILKGYSVDDAPNPFLVDLEAIREGEYEKCRNRFVSLSIRNNAVRLFKNKLIGTINMWLENKPSR